MDSENDIILEKKPEDQQTGEPDNAWSGKTTKKKKEPPVDGRKKPRSQAQIDAFKKMRDSRMRQMEEDKIKAREQPAKLKRTKPNIIQGDSDSDSSDEEPIIRRKKSSKRAQVVNNYYYGMPPPNIEHQQREPRPKPKPDPQPEPPQVKEPRKPRIQFA